MANFDSYNDKSIASRKAFNLLPQIQDIYQSGKLVQAALALYLAGTDTAFNAAVNAIFSGAERTELNQMLSQINALITDWETNHPKAIGL